MHSDTAQVTERASRLVVLGRNAAVVILAPHSLLPYLWAADQIARETTLPAACETAQECGISTVHSETASNRKNPFSGTTWVWVKHIHRPINTIEQYL